MLIKFSDIVKRHGCPKGIIHIGAHLMEERNDYLSFGLNNTIWVEANPKTYASINFVNTSTNERAFNYVISDIDNSSYDLNVTNNGQSSSILDLDKHKIYHPQIYISEVISVKSKRMDTLLSENNIDMNNYDFLNIDIQGAELLALKSFGEKLKDIKYIYTEVNTNYLYKDCALIGEIDEYLKQYGFSRIETEMTQFEWGDALYIKR